jgi:polyphosphate kinase 2 (PPK2 family)
LPRATSEMLERTNTACAPWHPVEADSKRWARVKVAETVNAALDAGMRAHGIDLPPPVGAG